SCPVVLERLVVGFLHEPVNTDKIKEAIGATRRWHIRRHERLVHRCEPLLSVQHDVFGSALSLEAINGLTGEGLEVVLFAFPKQQATDEIVKEDRAHELADIPRLPFKLALEIGNDETTLAKSVYEDHETDVIRLLGVLHAFPPPMISSSSPSASFSMARMSALISSSVRCGCGL